MPSFMVTTKDGTQYRIDGAADESAALAEFHRQNGGQTAGDTLVAPDIPNRSLSQGVIRGLRDPFEGLAQTAVHGAAALGVPGANTAANAVDQFVQKGEESYAKSKPNTAASVGRVAGNVLGTLPMFMFAPEAAPETLLGSAARAGAEGAALGVTQPVVTPGNFWEQKAGQVGSGAIYGGAGGLGTSAASRMIYPKLSKDLRTLLQAGVKPTTGQIFGGTFGRLEEAARSIPGLDSAVNNARNRSVDSFNKAVINDALSPIGESLSKSTSVGRDALNEAHDKIQQAYQSLVPKAGLRTDNTFWQNLQDLDNNARFMAPDRYQQFHNILQGKVLRKFSQGGGMTGESYKEVESDLGRLASDYRNSSDSDQRQLGGAILQLQAELRDQLARNYPDLAPQLKNANEAYARYLRVQVAGASPGALDGVIQPSQFSRAVRSLDPTLRKRAYALGSAKMQPLADAGKNVLSDKVANSGTPYRWMVGAAAPALVGGYFDPKLGLILGGTGVGIHALYSRPGQAILRGVLTKRPGVFSKAANFLQASRLPRGLAAYGSQPND